MTKVAEDLAVLSERLDNAIKMGGAAFTLSWVAIAFLIFYYLPTLIENKVTGQLKPVQDGQTLILENSPALLAEYLKSGISQPPEQKLEVALAMLKNAKQQKIVLPSDKIVEANVALKNFSAADTAKKWDVTLELAAYRSFANSQLYVPKTGAAGTCMDPSLQTPTKSIQHNLFRDCTQILAGGNWEDNIFENVVIVYDGSPIVFRRNQLINCRFQIKPNPNGHKFVENVIASPQPDISIHSGG